MAIEFYVGSGSQYAWRVWLALEHKQIPYELKLLSFSAGDTKKAAFLALNPRGKVPVVVDDGFVLYESAAILEYLEDQYPSTSTRAHLFPKDIKPRARARRQIREVDEYLGHAVETLAQQVLFTEASQRNSEVMQQAMTTFGRELLFFEGIIRGPFIDTDVSAVDFTLYPYIALARRYPRFVPELNIEALIGPTVRAWMTQVESLPYFERTVPPHWKQKQS